MYFVSKSELLAFTASTGPASAPMLSGNDSPAEDPQNQGPIVAPVTPNVSPILRDEGDPEFTKRRHVYGPLVHAPLTPGLGAPRGSLADQSLDAELDSVGNAVADLVAESAGSEEEEVEARYALADSKPKPGNEAEPKPQARQGEPKDSAEPPVTPVPRPPLVLPKVPASAAFPDAMP